MATNKPKNIQKPEFGTKLKFHFMGIGGSGISAVAALAKKHGFVVSGCDENKNTPYLDKLKKLGIKPSHGHSAKHLKGCDLLVISPAVVYQNKENPEYKIALKEGRLLFWNKFVGQYLLANKNVIAVSGTHGKGTTTAMLALLFEKAKLDPNVIVGATVPTWKSNFREGASNIFIIEADEFYEKFLDYNPSTIIVNNIEFDHPDYFKNEEQIIGSFTKFVKLLSGDKNLIINLDSGGNLKLLIKVANIKGINIYGYTVQKMLNNAPKKNIVANIIETNVDGTKFRVYSDSLKIDTVFSLTIPGVYNVSNALGVITVAKIFGVSDEIIRESLLSYNGLGRRFEKVFDKGITVYDDYAHHPTAIAETLKALRQRYPARRIICIDEPHSFSRTKALLSAYEKVFDSADKIIIGPIFKARDTKSFGITGADIVKKSCHKDISYITSLDAIIKKLKTTMQNGDVIIVMGAGESYLWAKEIVKMIERS